MNDVFKCAAVALVLLSFSPGALTAQSKDHFFPQIADGAFSDGSYYRSTIMVIPWFDTDAATCALRLYGMTATLDSTAGASFTIPIAAGSYYAGRTTAGQGFQGGYATMTCSDYVYAQVLYSFYAANGTKISEATVFSSSESYSRRLIFDYRDGARLGIAIANNTDLPRTYKLTVGTKTATLQIPARASAARFLDELISISPNQTGIVKIEGVDFVQFSAIGLRFTGAAFSTIPAN